MKNSLYKFVSIAIFVLISCSKQSPTGSASGDYSSSTDAYMATSAGPGPGGGNSGSGGGGQYQPGVITAGEWNDLDNWSFFKDILQKDDYAKIPIHWGFNPLGRVSVNVKGIDNQPRPDVPVKLLTNGQILFSAKTDNKGNAELYTDLTGNNFAKNLNQLELDINNGKKIIRDVKRHEEGNNNVVLPSFGAVKNNIDISFVIDATGSMGDELEYLKTELYDVINRAKSANASYSFSTSCVVYRDEGDDYLAKGSPFTADILSTIDFIKQQSATGGGDFPEAVHSGLDKAINGLQWHSDSRTRIIFLILDAPPHDTPAVIEKMHDLIMKASEKGIKIIPVTASGIDKDTEFLMRFIAISTNGTYVFITNDSGIGNDHLEPTVGKYTVEFLNNLMLRLINKYAE
jgi:hypothetical protein